MTTYAQFHAANLTDIYRRYVAEFGEDHPMTKRALSDARHAGVDILPGVLMGDIPEEDVRAYRGGYGELVGNRAVLIEDTAQTVEHIRGWRAAHS